MDIKTLLKNNILWFSVLAIIALLFIIPIKIPNALTQKSKLLPVKEWKLTRGTDGRLIASLKNLKEGIGEQYSVKIFERGDAVNFRMAAGIKAGTGVEAEQQVGLLLSSEIDLELARLEGLLQTKQAALRLNIAGEKESVLEELRKELLAAEQQAALQADILKRQKLLYERELVSEEDYQVEQSKAALYETGIEIAQARLATAVSGEKQEQIQFIESEIAALKKEIDVILKRSSDFEISSPISGQVFNGFAEDTLIIIKDVSEFIIYLPLDWADHGLLSETQEIEIRIPGNDDKLKAGINRIENEVRIIGGRQVVLISASLSNEDQLLLPGLIVDCSVSLKPVTTRQILIRFFKALIN